MNNRTRGFTNSLDSGGAGPCKPMLTVFSPTRMSCLRSRMSPKRFMVPTAHLLLAEGLWGRGWTEGDKSHWRVTPLGRSQLRRWSAGGGSGRSGSPEGHPRRVCLTPNPCPPCPAARSERPPLPLAPSIKMLLPPHRPKSQSRVTMGETSESVSRNYSSLELLPEISA